MGNGRLGAVVCGGVEEETLFLNESSVWSGSFEDADRQDAQTYLPEIRRLLAAGKPKEAEEIFSRHFTCKGAGSGFGNGAEIPFGCYQALGECKLSFFQYTPFHSDGPETLQNYRRTLDLEKAEAQVSFDTQNRSFSRDYLVSAPDEALVLRLRTTDKKGISLVASLNRTERSETRGYDGSSIVMEGTLPDGKGGDGVRFACLLRAVCEGGRVFVRQGRLYVEGAKEALLYLTAQTNMKGIVGRGNSDALQAAAADMERVSRKGWAEIAAAHEAYYSPLFHKTELTLPEEGSELPLPERMAQARAEGGSPSLDALYCAFGKYLFISSSRTGEIPANLQGIWAKELHTPWNGDWHFNAQQMLYWPAELWNLSALHEPYLRLIQALQEPGGKTARAYYGAGGWAVHTFTNPWGFTAPGEDAAWGSTTGSAAWLCQHLWDHYLYTGDRAYLEEAYPALRGAAEFYRDMLVKEPSHGWLVTSPSDSPENRYLTKEGDNCALCMGPTYDNQLVRYLFEAVCMAAKLLDREDDALLHAVKAALPLLPPTRVGSDGRILEWLEEYAEPLPYHRHVSHLWGLYPGNEITPEKTPELAQAARLSLLGRGDTAADWAMAYRACVWARLGDGEQAYRQAEKVLLYSTFPNLLCKCHHAPEDIQPAVLPGLEDNHFPYQMDGNMGILTAFAELLLQSRGEAENGELAYSVLLLPALPEKWAFGTVTGLRARGGFTVSLEWEAGVLKKAVLEGEGKLQVRYGETIRMLNLKRGVPWVLSGKELEA